MGIPTFRYRLKIGIEGLDGFLLADDGGRVRHPRATSCGIKPPSGSD